MKSQFTTEDIIEIYCTPMSPYESYESFERKEDTIWGWLEYIKSKARADWIDNASKEQPLTEYQKKIKEESKQSMKFLQTPSTEDVRLYIVSTVQELVRNGSDEEIDDTPFKKDFDNWLTRYQEESVQKLINKS